MVRALELQHRPGAPIGRYSERNCADKVRQPAIGTSQPMDMLGGKVLLLLC